MVPRKLTRLTVWGSCSAVYPDFHNPMQNWLEEYKTQAGANVLLEGNNPEADRQNAKVPEFVSGNRCGKKGQVGQDKVRSSHHSKKGRDLQRGRCKQGYTARG